MAQTAARREAGPNHANNASLAMSDGANLSSRDQMVIMLFGRESRFVARPGINPLDQSVVHGRPVNTEAELSKLPVAEMGQAVNAS